MINITYDPLGMLPKGTSTRLILDELGPLLSWAVEVSDDVIGRIYAHYGFETPPMRGGKIASDGTYNYPEDPPLFPLIRIEHKNETIYIYRYGIVGSVKGDIQKLYRRD